MAASGYDSLHTKEALCSICLEQYQSPVSLPCSHSFCQSCLYKHIISQCVNCDQPLGFSCTLCSEFVPAPGEISEYSVDQWAKLFPENKLLASITDRTNSIVCKPCQEDGENEIANSWCMDCCEALCIDCVRCHKRSRPSRQHVIASLAEFSLGCQQSFFLDKCEVHGRIFEVFCEDHLIPCCSDCITKEHESCVFCQIEDIDEKIFGPQKIQNLKIEVEMMCSKMKETITKERTNMYCIDDASGAYAKELSEMTTVIINTVKKLEEKHLNELAKLSEESKSKLEKSVQSIDQRLSYLQYWKDKLFNSMTNETHLKRNEVFSFIKMKRIYENIKKLDSVELEISIQSEIIDIVQKATCLSRLTKMISHENMH